MTKDASTVTKGINKLVAKSRGGMAGCTARLRELQAKVSAGIHPSRLLLLILTALDITSVKQYRNVKMYEDRIKADVRDDLRNIVAGREQYRISVQSAALAYERVVSTQLQLELGIAGVAARDFLEAQTAYASSLNSVASNHISYILIRTQLFLDMESLVLNEDGFWPELYEEGEQPQPAFQFDPRVGSAYGELPPQLRYSRFIRRMNAIPNGQPTINAPAASRGMMMESEEPPTLEPPEPGALPPDADDGQ